jgi:hypothetical protein
MSSNNGLTWSSVNMGISNPPLTCLAVSGRNIFAGVWGIGVLFSSNNGITWKSINNGLVGLTNMAVSSIVVSGKYIYIGTTVGVFCSTQTDTNWSATNIGLSNKNITSLALNGTTLYAGAQGSGIYSSNDFGKTWKIVYVDYSNSLFQCFAFSGSNVFIGTWGGGVFLSTNKGTNWSVSNNGLTNINVITSFAAYGKNVFTGVGNYGVFLSTNNGGSWNQVDDGLPMSIFPSVFSLAICGTYLYAGTWGPGIWRRPLSEMVTSVEGRAEELPKQYSLHQNYPNPFNPSTMISFGLHSKAFVNLKIYNTLGVEVCTLLTNELSAGDHVFKWDALTLSSGIYFCRLRVDSYISTIKMILLK